MESLGLNLAGTVFYLVSFLIALWVLNKYVFSVIAKIMSEREQSLKSALAQRDGIILQMQEVHAEADRIINNAKAEARLILNNAREEVEPEKRHVLDAAEAEKLQIIESAKSESSQIIERAKTQANNEAISVVEAVMQKSLNNLKLDATAANSIMAKIINNM